MANHTKDQQAELRAAIQAALDDGVETPSDVLEYLEDNDFEPLPTRPTVIAIMQKCGMEFISGYWVRTR